MPILFCNIAWMREYKGIFRLDQEPDDIPQRGGEWVNENSTAGECCNFLTSENGYVYGHVEASRGGQDHQVRIENLGANNNDDYVDDVEVIWIATHKNGGRRVVGWYKNAKVYRWRKYHDEYPTEQHEEDDIDNYRIKANQEDVHLIAQNQRKLRIGNGKGWPGQNPLFYPDNHMENNQDLEAFIKQLRIEMNLQDETNETRRLLTFNPESCGESTIQIRGPKHMSRIHGQVVNELYNILLGEYQERNLYNNQLIDLAVTEDGNLIKIFEVKTKNDRQSKSTMNSNSRQRQMTKAAFITNRSSGRAAVVHLTISGVCAVFRAFNNCHAVSRPPLNSVVSAPS